MKFDKFDKATLSARPVARLASGPIRLEVATKKYNQEWHEIPLHYISVAACSPYKGFERK